MQIYTFTIFDNGAETRHQLQDSHSLFRFLPIEPLSKGKINKHNLEPIVMTLDRDVLKTNIFVENTMIVDI